MGGWGEVTAPLGQMRFSREGGLTGVLTLQLHQWGHTPLGASRDPQPEPETRASVLRSKRVWEGPSCLALR